MTVKTIPAKEFFHSVHPIRSLLNRYDSDDDKTQSIMEPYDAWECSKNELLANPSDAAVVESLQAYYMEHGTFLRPLRVEVDENGLRYLGNGHHRAVTVLLSGTSETVVTYVEDYEERAVQTIYEVQLIVQDSVGYEEMSFESDLYIRSFPLLADSSAWCDLDFYSSQQSSQNTIFRLTISDLDIVGIEEGTPSDEMVALLKEGLLVFVQKLLPVDLFERTEVCVSVFERELDESEDAFYDRAFQ